MEDSASYQLHNVQHDCYTTLVVQSYVPAWTQVVRLDVIQTLIFQGTWIRCTREYCYAIQPRVEKQVSGVPFRNIPGEGIADAVPTERA
eukprot:1183720-Prorocentrum_minimum.AAC.2